MSKSEKRKSIRDAFSEKLWKRMQSEGFADSDNTTNRSREELEIAFKELEIKNRREHPEEYEDESE